MDMLISLIMVFIARCIHVFKHHIVCIKYIPFLFANHTLIKLEKISLEVSNSTCM